MKILALLLLTIFVGCASNKVQNNLNKTQNNLNKTQNTFKAQEHFPKYINNTGYSCPVSAMDEFHRQLYIENR
jgi:hypothetical protein